MTDMTHETAKSIYESQLQELFENADRFDSVKFHTLLQKAAMDYSINSPLLENGSDAGLNGFTTKLYMRRAKEKAND